MKSNFYDDHYYANHSDAKSHEVHLAKIRATNFFKGLVNAEEGQKILDIGCGDGMFLASLEGRGADLWGIDISRNITDIAKRNVSKSDQIICKSAEKLPFDDEEFDWVTAWGVIEHFPDMSLILKDIRRVMKKNSKAVIMVPNVYYYKFIWDTLRKGVGPDKHQEIEFLYSFGEWKQLIELSGLLVEKVLRHNKFNKSSLSIKLRNIFIPFYFSNHFIFVCVTGNSEHS